MSADMKTVLASKHYGFMGSGNMSQALVKGFLASNVVTGSQVTMTDRYGLSFPDAEFLIPLKSLCSKYGVEYIQTNEPMVEKSDVVFACVKPHILLPALKSLSDRLNDKLLVSIAAGITLDQIQQAVPKSTRIIRIMPNTPCLVGVGTAVYAHTSSVTDEDINLISALCSSIFPVFEAIPESLFNAAVGVSGSSPAYTFIHDYLHLFFPPEIVILSILLIQVTFLFTIFTIVTCSLFVSSLITLHSFSKYNNIIYDS
ncbi:unnamed protein product [Schistosoma mattheei]|uniref:Pyrroline-5-carboxylate reductase catalytic N-terminal domain-containing protein n=1 Tax=Schistosoma mattheei TaxID=31246 RepID=A0AA85BB00_9TREM|nr:unnamed protein product [Schistosoma mattheei]